MRRVAAVGIVGTQRPRGRGNSFVRWRIERPRRVRCTRAPKFSEDSENDIGFNVTPASVDGILPAARGSQATEATYQNDSRARPSIQAQFKKKKSDLTEFRVTIDRAAIAVEPVGIDIEPCGDGQTTTHGLWFDLTCLGGGIEFEQEATWRVPGKTCP